MFCEAALVMLSGLGSMWIGYRISRNMDAGMDCLPRKENNNVL